MRMAPDFADEQPDLPRVNSFAVPLASHAEPEAREAISEALEALNLDMARPVNIRLRGGPFRDGYMDVTCYVQSVEISGDGFGLPEMRIELRADIAAMRNRPIGIAAESVQSGDMVSVVMGMGTDVLAPYEERISDLLRRHRPLGGLVAPSPDMPDYEGDGDDLVAHVPDYVTTDVAAAGWDVQTGHFDADTVEFDNAVIRCWRCSVQMPDDTPTGLCLPCLDGIRAEARR